MPQMSQPAPGVQFEGSTMASETTVELWNRALAKVGEGARVADPSENTVHARACRQVFDDCLGELLEDFPWSFAKGQASIASLAAVSRVGWEHAYELPEDFVAPRAVLDSGVRYSLIPGEARIPHELQANDARDGQVFCTDADLSAPAVLEYTTWFENVAAFPRLFLDALAWRMAAELALSLKAGGQERYDEIMDERRGPYARAFAKAATADLRGRQDDPELDPPSIRARQ